ncbi:MAG: phosphoribosylamine--glycine ligase [Thermoplasmatales archaeon]|nr:phosphoribosylamine--glycine ligase [Thermoplasmatales archaeon]
MKVLVIGGGAREHAICIALKNSDAEIYSVMKNSNPGIKRIAKDYFLHDECDAEKVVSYAISKNIELAVVGPEAPLQAGVTNLLMKNEIAVASPLREAAEIETDKEFMRRLMKKYRVRGNVEFGAFSDAKSAEKFINELQGNVAVKPVGLTGGKGVRVYGFHFDSAIEANEYAKEIISKKIGGKSRVLIEERMIGEEFTLQAFCDGKNIFPMPVVQDYKRLLPNDEGPNTGGMGSISSKDFILPFMERYEYEEACIILQKIIEALKKEGREYRGVIYGQFMLTSQGVKVIEINARFGDPEAMNVLSILKTDFVEICNAMAEGNLRNNMIGFNEKSTVCKYVVPCGYGYKPLENKEIFVDEKKIEEEGGKIFYASVNEENGKIYTTKSRSLAILGIADEIYEAEEICENCLKNVKGDIFVRHDIGKKEIIEKKMNRLKMLRG